MKRKLTPEEIAKLHDELLEHLNKLADSDSRKKNFMEATRRERKYEIAIAEKIRQQINSGLHEPEQMEILE
jgi:predicted transcriptional regulator